MSTALATTNSLSAFLEKNKKQIAHALPKHLNPDRMCRLALTSFSQTRKLAECDLNTIFASVVIASQLGLEIGVAGQGFLVPYKGKCTFIPGWQGLVDLVTRSGRANVWTGGVFDGDEFDWALGDSPFVKHKPKGEDDIKKLTHTYAIGRTKGTEWPIVEVWPQARLLAHRDKYNKVGEDHYSFKSWEMYARKIPLLQVIKYLPKSIELANALALESAYAQGKTPVLEGDYVRVDGDDDPEPDPTRKPSIAPYPDDKFTNTLPKWAELIKSGKKTAAEIIVMVSTTAVLSDEQKRQINAIAAPKVDAGFVADMENAQ